MPTYLRSFSTPAVVADDKVPVESQDGVVTRICSFKYGFIQTADLRNIFFHFSELSDAAKAVVEPGCRVKYNVTTNEWTSDKKMKAINIEVVSTPDQNAYKNIKGVVHRELGPRGFGFIQCDNTTYFFPSNELVADAESNSRGNTARAGDEVVFDASWNHKYNPPKPYATNVRLVSAATPNRRNMSHIQRSNSVAVCGDSRSENNQSPTSDDTESDDSGNSRTARSWRRDNRGRTHARGSSLSSLIPMDSGVHDSTSSIVSAAPAVGKTSSSRVNRVMGSCKPYSGDFSNQQQRTPQNNDDSLLASAGLAVNNRALALKHCEPPKRMGSRQLSSSSELPATGSAATDSIVGSSSSKNNNNDDTASDEQEVSADESGAPSMGEASLRVLVKALVHEGTTQYLCIRNTLQRAEYFGRSLTREEKQTISDILQKTMNEREDGVNNNGKHSKKKKDRKHNKEYKPQPEKRSYSRQSSKGVRRQHSRPLQGQLSRCNSSTNDPSRPPLARSFSRGVGAGGVDRLSLTERLSTTDRLSLTQERLSLHKQYSTQSSMGKGDDFDFGNAVGNLEEHAQYSLFADEPMRVSDCLAPVNCP